MQVAFRRGGRTVWTVDCGDSTVVGVRVRAGTPDGERELVNNQLELVSFATSNNLIVVSFEIGGY